MGYPQPMKTEAQQEAEDAVREAALRLLWVMRAESFSVLMPDGFIVAAGTPDSVQSILDAMPKND